MSHAEAVRPAPSPPAMQLQARSLALLVCPLLSAPALAQLQLDKSGGGLPGVAQFALSGGGAGEAYVILPSLVETPTAAPTGAQLAIGLDLLDVAIGWPGFVGLLDGSGSASALLPLPPTAGLAGITLSVQGVAGNPALSEASNLVRLTPQLVDTFSNTLGAPVLPVVGGAIAPLADGRLELVGGSGPLGQIYDPDLEEFELGGLSFGVGLLSQSTTLDDGRILFTGGLGLDGQPSANAAVYDPADGTTTEISMSVPRAGHGASVLGDGRVLLTGGFSALDISDLLTLLSGVQASSEFFDPNTNTFVSGPNMLEPRALHTQTPLANGGALVAGGLTLIPLVNLPIVSATAYEFSPGLGTFGLPKFFAGARLGHAATLLDNGRVLLCGGLSIDFGDFFTTFDPLELSVGALDDCLEYSTGFFGGFDVKPGLSSGRAFASALSLGGGEALIAGGLELVLDLQDPLASQFVLLDDADRYSGGALQPSGNMQGARLLPVLQGLDDGTVLVVGGGPLEAEVFQP